MYYIYLLKSKKDNFLYTGRTNNIEERFKEHNKGYVLSTKMHTPFELVYYEAYLHPQDASDRENKLKHHGSVIGHLKKRIKNSLNN
jgi:putative endonuclease